MPRQKATDQFNRPRLERLGQNGVIRVAEDALSDAPGAIPFEQLLIDENAHQFGNGDRWMRVVELNRYFVRKLFPRAFRPLLESPDDILNRRRDEEVLLFESQLASGRLIVGGVEDFRDVLAAGLVLDRGDISANVEFLQIEFTRGLRRPETQRIHCVIAIAGDAEVVGHRVDVLSVNPSEPASRTVAVK